MKTKNFKTYLPKNKIEALVLKNINYYAMIYRVICEKSKTQNCFISYEWLVKQKAIYRKKLNYEMSLFMAF